MDVEPELIAYAITLIVSVLATFLGDRWQKAKKMLAQSQLTSLKFAQSLKVLSTSIEDDKITAEEEKKIVSTWKELIDEAKYLVGKNY